LLDQPPFLLLTLPPPPLPTLFPYTTLFRSSIGRLITGEMSVKTLGGPLTIAGAAGDAAALGLVAFAGMLAFLSVSLGVINLLPVDRKSTRLNSSHVKISYAVFCLKKKTLLA